MEVLPDVKCSWRRASWKFQKIWKLCETYNSKIILRLFSMNMVKVWEKMSLIDFYYENSDIINQFC